MNKSGTAIHIRELAKTFRVGLRRKRTRVLHGLSLDVMPGEVMGFLGPNGAGKTTTIKILVGLLRPDGGHAEIFGESIRSTGARRRTAYQPELPDFYDFMTAGELMLYCGRIAGVNENELKRRAPELLERVGLESASRKRIGKFSRGMRQRVGIAQAMLADPDLYILDEPMGGLDPIGRRWMKDLILDLGKAGKTVFFSSHVLAEAEAVCNRVAFIHMGRVVAHGPLAQILKARDERWEIVIEGETARADEQVAGLAVEVVAAGADTLLLSDEAQPDELLGCLLQRKHRIRSVNKRHASLEDVFLETVASDRAKEES